MAKINVSLAAGSIASPYYFDVKVTKQLCAKTSKAPVFVPVMTLVDYTSVGTNEYEALVNIQGVVTYTPCGSCCAKTQTINQTFRVPFYSASAVTSVTVEGGSPTMDIVNNGGCGCGNVMVANIPLNLTVVTA